jgi:hypothetical protein
MKFDELVSKLQQSIPHPDYAVAWYVPGEYSDASYSIVPLPDGRFTLYRPSGRGTYHEDFDAAGDARIFDDEDAVCDFVWAKLTEPTAPARVAPQRSPEERAARADAQRARVQAKRGSS